MCLKFKSQTEDKIPSKNESETHLCVNQKDARVKIQRALLSGWFMNQRSVAN